MAAAILFLVAGLLLVAALGLFRVMWWHSTSQIQVACFGAFDQPIVGLFGRLLKYP
jgi:hypothetical protein